MDNRLGALTQCLSGIFFMWGVSATHRRFCLVSIIFRMRSRASLAHIDDIDILDKKSVGAQCVMSSLNLALGPGSEASLLLVIFSQHKLTLQRACSNSWFMLLGWGGLCILQFLSLRNIHHLSVVLRNTDGGVNSAGSNHPHIDCRSMTKVRGAFLLQSHNF